MLINGRELLADIRDLVETYGIPPVIEGCWRYNYLRQCQTLYVEIHLADNQFLKESQGYEVNPGIPIHDPKPTDPADPIEQPERETTKQAVEEFLGQLYARGLAHVNEVAAREELECEKPGQTFPDTIEGFSLHPPGAAVEALAKPHRKFSDTLIDRLYYELAEPTPEGVWEAIEKTSPGRIWPGDDPIHDEKGNVIGYKHTLKQPHASEKPDEDTWRDRAPML